MYQILTNLLKLGYERYQLNGNPLGTKIECNLFRKNETKPSVTVMATTSISAIRLAEKRAQKQDLTKPSNLCYYADSIIISCPPHSSPRAL